jgi:hypothetical protein
MRGLLDDWAAVTVAAGRGSPVEHGASTGATEGFTVATLLACCTCRQRAWCCSCVQRCCVTRQHANSTAPLPPKFCAGSIAC